MKKIFTKENIMREVQKNKKNLIISLAAAVAKSALVVIIDASKDR